MADKDNDSQRFLRDVEDLVARYIVSLDSEGDGHLEDLCAAHPELSDELRYRITQLGGLGLLDCELDERPSQIGPYRILDEIGSGGMGSVYLAEQLEPVQRRVAVKVIKLGMDTRDVVARFDAERQALACMDHPNVAKVFDAGATADGRPYFVMEYVPGQPLTEFCDQRKMSTEQRLELFVHVCFAVQHAHNKGIIHRDLKPSNILVTEHDGLPLPKIIDFGIAKATSARLTDSPQYTQPGQIVGTPAYMSPEQANSDGTDIDTRTDVYSLGVVLYELLCGELPFAEATLHQVGMAEMLRVLREDNPVTPSTRVRTTAIAEHTATARSTSVGTLRRQLSGDLDWITLRALAKERSRRYGTVLEFAHDVQRHLDAEPVLAGPPGFAYRASKFYRRHRAPVIASSVALVALVAGLIASVGFYLDARRARVDEASAHDETRASLDTARDAIERMLVHLGDERLRHIPEMSVVRGELLDEALGFYRGLLERRGADPRLRTDMARVHDLAATIYQHLGRLPEAERAARAALDAAVSLAAEDPTSTRYEVMHACYDATLADILRQRGRHGDARLLLQQSLSRFDRLRRTDEYPPEMTVQEAVVHNNLALMLREEDAPRGFDHARRAVALQEQVVASSVGADDMIHRLASFRTSFADLMLMQGQHEEAEALQRQAIQAVTQLVERHDTRSDFRNALAFTHDAVAELLEKTNRVDEAVSERRLAIPHWRRLAKDFPRQVRYRGALAETLHSLAVLLNTSNRRDDAIELNRDAITLREELVREVPDLTTHRVGLAMSLANQAAMLTAGGKTRPEAVERTTRRAIDLFEQLLADRVDDPRIPRNHAAATGLLAMILMRTDRRDEAEKHYGAARAQLIRLIDQAPDRPDPRHQLSIVLSNLARLQLARRDSGEACELLERASKQQRLALAVHADHPRYKSHLQTVTLALANARVADGNHAGAAEAAEELLRLAPGMVHAYVLAGGVFAECGKLVAASNELAGEPRRDRIRGYQRRAIETLQVAQTGFAQIVQSTKRPVRVRGEWADACSQLGRVLQRLGSEAEARQQFALAVTQRRMAWKAGKENAVLRPGLIAAHAESISASLAAGDVTAAAASAVALAQTLPDDAPALFAAGRELARCAAAAEESRADYSDRAMTRLTQSIDKGYRPEPVMQKDPALRVLYGRRDFHALASRSRR